MGWLWECLGKILNNVDPKDGVTCFERFMDFKERVKKDFVLYVVFNILMFARGKEYKDWKSKEMF